MEALSAPLSIPRPWSDTSRECLQFELLRLPLSVVAGAWNAQWLPSTLSVEWSPASGGVPPPN